jgi:hypothetical protein
MKLNLKIIFDLLNLFLVFAIVVTVKSFEGNISNSLISSLVITFFIQLIELYSEYKDLRFQSQNLIINISLLVLFMLFVKEIVGNDGESIPDAAHDVGIFFCILMIAYLRFRTPLEKIIWSIFQSKFMT